MLFLLLSVNKCREDIKNSLKCFIKCLASRNVDIRGIYKCINIFHSQILIFFYIQNKIKKAFEIYEILISLTVLFINIVRSDGYVVDFIFNKEKKTKDKKTILDREATIMKQKNHTDLYLLILKGRMYL